MLSCKDISKLASEHIDNNLPFMTKMKVKMHLFMCHKCRDFVNQLKITVKAVQTLKSPPIDENTINNQTVKLMELTKNLNSDQTKPHNH